ncbi:MAG: RsmD family RNA methyltransferase [Fervidobacterium sp.]
MLTIESGFLRGKKVDIVNDSRTRYTSAIVRRSLANMIDFENKICADICCGSGVVGFEMISNGAMHVTFVDTSNLSIATVKKNAEALSIESHVSIFRNDARKFLESYNGTFDIIYSDPPYELGIVDEIVKRVYNVMNENSIFILQCSKREKPSENMLKGIRMTKEKDYGDTFLLFFEKIL